MGFYKKYFIFAIIVSLKVVTSNDSKAQQLSWIQQYRKLSLPERCWVLKHPFKVKRAWQATSIAKAYERKIKAENILIGVGNGDQVDAFRHAFWMATLTQKIGRKAALSLGKAHEKGNYKQFLKGSLEDGTLPDKASCDMDLWNNAIGADIGKLYKDSTSNFIQTKVIEYILQGKMLIIKRDTAGNFLDCDNNKINMAEWKRNWLIPKCLVPSNQVWSN